MKNIVHYAVAGVIAAAMMVLLRLLLAQQPALAAYHCPGFELAGQDGLRQLLQIVIFGAAYGAAYGLLLQALLPGGLIIGSLALGCVPTLVSALVMPLRAGLPAVKDPWTLLWMFAHWVFYALCLIFILGPKGSKDGKKHSDD